MTLSRATLQELEMFSAIAHHRSFRKAAQARNVTPSALLSLGHPTNLVLLARN